MVYGELAIFFANPLVLSLLRDMQYAYLGVCREREEKRHRGVGVPSEVTMCPPHSATRAPTAAATPPLAAASPFCFRTPCSSSSSRTAASDAAEVSSPSVVRRSKTPKRKAGSMAACQKLRLRIGHVELVGHEDERREQAFEDVQLDGAAAVVREQEASQERLELVAGRAGPAEHRKRTVPPMIERLVEHVGSIEVEPPGGAEAGRNGAAGRELELEHDVRKQKGEAAASGGTAVR